MEFNQENFDKLLESVGKLEANNKDLKSERNRFKEAAAKFEGIDLASLQAASDKLAKMEKDKLEQDGEYKKLYDNLQKQHATDVANLKQERENLQAKFDHSIKLNDLNSALVSVKVDPVLLDVASTSLIGQVGLVEGKAMVGGKTVSEFVKEWAEGEVGKRFIPSGNSGGGGKGSDGGAVQTEAAWFDPKSPEFNRTKQGQLRRTNPELAEKLAARFKGK